MTARDPRFDGPLDGDAPDLDALGGADPAPDLTRSIMGRLGYMRVSGRIARRRRIRAAIGRTTTVVAAFGLIALGLRLHESSPGARRPVGLTIPAAIGHDVGLTQERFSRAIRGMRDLLRARPAALEPAAPDPVPEHDEEVDEDVNRSAIGPMRWL
jgi:hypothetical protein